MLSSVVMYGSPLYNRKRLYRFHVRRTESKFNAIILKRLFMSKINKPPMSLSRLIRYMQGKEDKIAMLVGKFTDDKRGHDIPTLKVAALRFTETARARIEKAGLFRMPSNSSPWSVQRMPALGVPQSHTKPYVVRSKGQKVEKARGSRSFRV
ncbi:hypothetical protein MLD38_010533 [Melastoma candidum]|uniref:Uncharacterized protein n=1 Tax=Melastoma candidum TaxID=119954 RepID=A0ACB9QZL2_9MYRT|nr:hypothetical protein MLD38_010533 [Melastoma candidum]